MHVLLTEAASKQSISSINYSVGQFVGLLKTRNLYNILEIEDEEEYSFYYNYKFDWDINDINISNL